MEPMEAKIAALSKDLKGYFDDHTKSHSDMGASLAVLASEVTNVRGLVESIDARVAEQNGRVRHLEVFREAIVQRVNGLQIDSEATEKRIDRIPGRVRSWLALSAIVFGLLGGLFTYAVDFASEIKAASIAHEKEASRADSPVPGAPIEKK